MASSIVRSAAEKLSRLLVEEARYLYAVSDKIEFLRRDLQWMQCFLEDADNRQHREKVVGMWVAEIRDFAYETEDIIERYVHEISHPRQIGVGNDITWFMCVLSDARSLHDVGSNIEDLRIRMSNLTSRLQMYGIQITRQPAESSSYNSRMREQRQRIYFYVEEDPIGLGKHIKEVMDRLLSDNQVKVVGIPGMGGLGKTTLARKVYLDNAVKEHFDNYVWVSVSEQFESRNVFQEILIGLTNMDGDGGGDRLRKKIKQLTNLELPKKISEILRQKKCLVVLDDIWDTNSWDTLKPAFNSIEGSGSKILITTRDLGLAQYADHSGYSHSFGFLSEEDSWRLLQQKVFLQDERRVAETEAKMEVLGKEMLKHCQGLPLAIVTLGGILATKRTINEWERVHKNITSYLMSDLGRETGDNKNFQVLELSYDDLPYYLKPCFMYLGSFPEGSEVPAHKLYHLWEGEGLVTFTGYDAEIQGLSLDDIAESYLTQLVKRSMVQVEKSWENGRIKTCRLHDMMRNMCIRKCEEVNFLNTMEHGSSTEVPSKRSYPVNKQLRRCALYLRNDYVLKSPFDPHVNEAPCIRTLLVFRHGSSQAGELPSKSMRKFFSLLRVLDVEGTSIKHLPRAIGDFIHLRYLSLRRTWVSDLSPSIWDCKYLETLDLRCYHKHLKLSNKFWNLERLRHLYLPRRLKLEGRRQLILSQNQLQQMETLKNFDVERCQIQDLGKMENLRIFSFTDRIEFISKLVLELLFKSPVITTERLINSLRLNVAANTINEEPRILTLLASHVSISVSLRICGSIKVNTDYSDILPHNLTRLRLDGCELNDQGISVLEKLPRLKQLVLSGKAIQGDKMIFTDGGFPQLTTLHLKCLEDLSEWEVGEGCLTDLRHLYLIGCSTLKIPQSITCSTQMRY